MLIKGVLKVQYYSFILLNLIFFATAIFSLMPICMLAMLVILICINTSRASLTLILICILAMLNIYMLIKGVLKVQCYSFISLNLVFFIAATLWP